MWLITLPVALVLHTSSKAESDSSSMRISPLRVREEKYSPPLSVRMLSTTYPSCVAQARYNLHASVTSLFRCKKYTEQCRDQTSMKVTK